MADGQPRSYSANARAAATAASNCSPDGCDACIKTGLPVFLVRPGLVDKDTAEKAASTIGALLSGVADPRLTHAGYAMRTLREGYLYAYYEEAHTVEIKEQGGWQAFRVDDGGYLTPTTLAALASGTPPEFACARASSYATAMLFVIPDAKNTKRVWMGFSASPWSQETLDNYAGKDGETLRKDRMACVDAATGSSERSIALTAGNIEAGVADYMPQLSTDALRGNPFPRRPLAPVRADDSVGPEAAEPQHVPSQSALFPERPMKHRPEAAAKLHEQATELIVHDPGKRYTDSNLLIVSVPDPEGVTHEAAVRRVTLCNTAAEWVASFPDGQWMMKSALQAEGMLGWIEQQGEGKKAQYEDAGYRQYDGARMYRSQFDALKREGKLPPDADFIPQTSHDGMARAPDYSKRGWISVPDAADIDRATGNLQEEVRGQLTRKIEGLDYRAFLNCRKEMEDADADRLRLIEQDYFAWLHGDALKLVTCHDFSPDSHVDGWFYAQCVRTLTYGGPLTDTGFEVFKSLLGGEGIDASDTNALLGRALLGNQPDFIDWLGELEQGNKAYGIAKGLFDLDPVKEGLTSAWRNGAQLIAQDLQSVAGATLAGLDKLGELSEKLRYQYELLSMMVVTKSEASPVELLRLRLTLPEAARVWNTMLADVDDAIQKAGEVGSRKVQSLVLGMASAVEMNAGSVAAMGTIDVYLLASGNDATWQKYTAPLKDRSRRYLVQPIKAGGEAVVHYIDDIGLRAMTRDSMRILRTGSGALAAGAGALQALSLSKAWGQYRNGSTKERQAAMVSMLTGGLGVSSAMYELGALAARRATEESAKELAGKGLVRVAGFIAAGATAIDAVMALVSSVDAYTQGDDSAGHTFVLQAMLFGSAAAAFAGATVATFTGGMVAGFGALALTGWGLLLVGLGVLVGFLVMVLKDKPIEAWAARTLWGDADASKRWGSFEREIQEANKVIASVTVDFAYRWNPLEKVAAIAPWLSPVTALSNATAAVLGLPTLGDTRELATREVWLRLKMPKDLREKLPWRVRIYATGEQGTLQIANAAGDGNRGGSYSSEESLPRGASNYSYIESENGNEVVISADLDWGRYRSAYARIEIFISAAAGDLYGHAVGNGEATVLVLDQEIRE